MREKHVKNRFEINAFYMYVFFKNVSRKCLKTNAKCTHLLKLKLFTKNAVFLHVFFKLVSTKFLKTHEKCIHFTTVFARVLQAFTKVKIAHKNAVFSFFLTCLYKVSQNACKIHSFQNLFCMCFALTSQSEIALKKAL